MKFFSWKELFPSCELLLYKSTERLKNKFIIKHYFCIFKGKLDNQGLKVFRCLHNAMFCKSIKNMNSKKY